MASKFLKVGQWDAARLAVIGMSSKAEKAIDKANKQEAQLFKSLVLRAFNTSGKSNGKAWEKLKPSTIKRKGSSKPLIDTKMLRNAISVIEQGDEIFVGVPASAMSVRGVPLTTIADVHEKGKIIIQQRGGKSVLIRIPKRSFLQATADFHFKPEATKARFYARVLANMGPAWASRIPSAKALAGAGLVAAKKR